MKRIIVLTEDEYTKLKKYILDAMYDYQHTRGGIGERLQKAIDILDGGKVSGMPDCNNCIWSTRDGRCVEWNCDFVSHDMARKMLNTVRSTAQNNAYTMAAYNSLKALRKDGDDHADD